MNRFRTRRKVKEGDDTSESRSTPLGPSKTFKKSKKKQQDEPPSFDLKTALPSSDDFRTSLLMPNLSARFSMLREQDDPNSKIGKANDDSVLFPKRASKLNLFSHTLADIDEVSSLKGSIRPPFATAERSNSFASDGGYGTDDDSNHSGSVMGRAKPGQGNNLFGGRQKLYTIPVSSSSSKTLGSPGLSGKQRYGDDFNISAFQSLRDKEKEDANTSEDEYLPRNSNTTNEENEPVNSPSTNAFSKNRETVSSTNSGPSNNRTSTAATSIDSQPTNTPQLSKTNSFTQSALDRQATIHRRLYGQALEQTSSARDILDNITRQRAASNDRIPHPLLQSKSATNISERFQRSAPVYSSTTLRSASPPPSASPSVQIPMDLGIRDHDTDDKSSEQNFGYMPPLSPPLSDSESTAALQSSLQPEDHGKATAMGLFNKPHQQYDEQQFSQRQMQMHVGNQTPLSRRTPPPTSALPSIPTRPSTASRASSNASSAGSRPPSAQTGRRRESPKPISTRQGPGLPTVSGSPPDGHFARGTFFETLSPSDESDLEQTFVIPAPSSPELHDIHPAFRTEHQSEASDHAVTILPAAPESPLNLGSDAQPNLLNPRTQAMPSPSDSPTLGPVGGIGGLVRTHLRHDSEQSAYPPSPGFPMNLSDSHRLTRGSTAAHPFDPAEYAEVNPFEHEETLLRNIEEAQSDNQPVPSSMVTMTEKARQILGQATALREQKQTKTQQILGNDAPQSHDDQLPSRTWQEEMRLRSQRDDSMDSEKDRDDFNNELAERRRRVRENLKSIVEVNSRSGSPVPPSTSESRQSRAGNAFSILRSKTSKQNMAEKSNNPNSKAMKMLGIGSAAMSSGSNNPPRANMWEGEEQQMLEGIPRRPVPRAPRNPVPPPAYHSPRRPSVDSQAQNDSHSEDRNMDEDGSNSEPRKPRTENYRDDLEQAMDQGQGAASREYAQMSSMVNRAQPRPSLDSIAQHSSGRSPSAASGRFEPSPRTTQPTSHYFESKSMSSVRTNHTDNGMFSRPSPSPAPYSANSTPPLYIDDYSPAQTSGEVSTGHSTPSLPLQRPPRKFSVTKGMISEPTFLSSTSTVPTFGLPSPATTPNNLGSTGPSHGVPVTDVSPPLPAMNPRRRRPTTTVQTGGNHSSSTKISHLLPRSANAAVSPAPFNDEMHITPASAVSGQEPNEDRSQFSDDNDKHQKRPRTKLRKSSSEGGSLNARARAERMKGDISPGLPMQSPSPVPYQQSHSPYPQGAGPKARPRAPTGGGFPPMMHNQTGRMTPPIGPPRHAGKPMGWQGPSPPTQLEGRIPGPGPIPMAIGRPPMRPMGPPSGRSTPTGRVTPSGPPPGMRAPSRQRDRTVEGSMF